MKQYLFLGDSITDADHLFDPANLGYGYVSLLARRPEYADARFVNRGHEGFTIERVSQMLRRDGIGGHWDAITLLAGVNDIPVELYFSLQDSAGVFCFLPGSAGSFMPAYFHHPVTGTVSF